jgi:hypothetical protein
MGKVQSFFATLKQNAEFYSAIVLGILAILVGVFGGSIELLIGITSGTLATIALGLLRDRDKTDEIKTIVKHIDQVVTFPDKWVMTEVPSTSHITDVIQSGNQELKLLFRGGNSLRAVLPYIQQALERGCKIHLMLCAQETRTVDLLAFRLGEKVSSEAIRQDIQLTIAFVLNRLVKASTVPVSGKIEIKAIAYIPSIGICLSDPMTLTGKVFAQLATFQSVKPVAPAIKITKIQDQTLFEFFRKEFESYWNAAEPVSME